MVHKIEISFEAIQDTGDAIDYYDSERTGLGLLFETELERFYDSLLQNPGAYSFITDQVRQGKIKRFPYVVVYEIKGNIIYVLRIFNTHQNPSTKFPA